MVCAGTGSVGLRFATGFSSAHAGAGVSQQSSELTHQVIPFTGLKKYALLVFVASERIQPTELAFLFDFAGRVAPHKNTSD